MSGCASTPTPPPVWRTPAYVVLLHGLGSSPLYLRILEKRIAKRGYETVNIGYPSRRHPVDMLANTVLKDALAERCPDADRRIHFVTHSMGGIVLRAYLKNNVVPNLGRVVMLAPPNKGSQLVEKLEWSRAFRVLVGPAGLSIGVEPDSVPNTLGPVDFKLGVITGDRFTNPITWALMPKPSDGKVTVANAKVEGMADFLVVHRGHIGIILSKKVAAQIVHFLEHGRFKRNDNGTPKRGT